MKIINNKVFTDIGDFNPMERDQDIQSGDQNNFLSNTRKLTIGEGSASIKMGKEGLWSGSRTFITAPFRMDINGNMTWNDGTTDRMYIGKV
jgi:hypothetical protein